MMDPLQALWRPSMDEAARLAAKSAREIRAAVEWPEPAIDLMVDAVVEAYQREMMTSGCRRGETRRMLRYLRQQIARRIAEAEGMPEPAQGRIV